MRHRYVPAVFALTLAACGQPGTTHEPAMQVQAVSGAFSRWGTTWNASNWRNGDALFGCTFSPNAVTLGSGPDQAVYGWLGGDTCTEIKSKRWKTQGQSFGGDLYVPAITGTTTTVFTYMNNGTLWNEIDAEFIPGKGAFHPALIFRNGGNRYVYEAWLPTVSNAWHHVEVRWQATQIQWSVDQRLVFTMQRNASMGLGQTVVSTSASSLQVPAAAWPTQSQQLFANFWRGSNNADATNFLGRYSGGSGVAIWNNLF